MHSDIGSSYKTSSKIIKWDKSDDYEVLQIIKCASNHDAIILECEMIRDANAVHSDNYYNRAHPYIGFNGGQFNMFTAKDDEGRLYFIRNDDPRFLQGELYGIRKGGCMPESFKRMMSDRKKNTVVVKDSTGKVHIVDRDDTRYTSGQLTPINVGRVVSEETRNRISESNRRTKQFTDNRLSQETKDKISKTTKGRPKSESHREKIRLANQNMSQETRDKISKSNKGKKRTAEQNERNRQARLGTTQSTTTKQKKSKHFSNTVWVSRCSVNKRVLKAELDLYLADGWTRGRALPKKVRVTDITSNTRRIVPQDDPGLTNGQYRLGW
jgi:hypothetical protein